MYQKEKLRYFIGDFETTVFEGQEYTEVWASALVELYSEDVMIHHSLEETFDYLKSLNSNICIWYHNLKFDGSFWLYFLIEKLHFKQAYEKVNECCVEWIRETEMPSKTFKYSISDRGQWYTITIKIGKHYIYIRDSLKLLPFSVKRIGKGFKTKHQKLDMEYVGFRYSGCNITDEEKRYIANDVLVVKEAMEIMFEEGHKKLTIGSCCLSEYKKIMGKEDYSILFPSMEKFEINPNEHIYENADAWIRKTYRGGWCYLVKGKENILMHDGTTADVNSLYPSMMSSESGNKFPHGKPVFWTGNYIPKEALDDSKYYFIHIRTRFKIKEGYLPFIQIKGSYLYKGTECLETSDVWNYKKGEYVYTYKDVNGITQKAIVDLYLTMTDYELLKEHYDLYETEIIDGCYFWAMTGLFDEYIEKYKKIKLNSKGALRELAKLFLNNLYGKFASNTDSSFKVAYINDEGAVSFYSVVENNKKAGYIPVGSAITSYARNFTIRAAQKNYYGKDKRGFIYADTDSIHCNLKPEEIKGIKVHDKDFCCWKLESQWDKGIFVRQKTYIEHVVGENLEPLEHPYNNIKCAGMPNKCKDLFELSMNGGYEDKKDEFNEEELQFLFKNNKPIKRSYEDFKIGLKIPGKLMPKRIKGGTLLVDTSYEMR